MHVTVFVGVFRIHNMDVSILMIPIMWCLIWHLLYELPQGNDNLDISLSLPVHHKCPPVRLLLPGHLLALVDAFDTLAWSKHLAAPAGRGANRRAGSRLSN